MSTAPSMASQTFSRTAFLTRGHEGFERHSASVSQAERDAELIDAMVAHVRTPLAALVVDGYAPKSPSDNLLVRHLEFFDRDKSGTISSKENYLGWRAIGLSPLNSAIQTIGSAVVFGGGITTIRPAHLGAAMRGVYCALAHDSMPALEALDLSIDATMENRPANPSGVLDAQGRLNETRFRELISEFLRFSRQQRLAAQPADTMTKKQFSSFLRTEAVKGLSKKQFMTMLKVMDKCGGDGLVRPIHLAAIYSGALLYNAKAVLDRF